jgi:hypothetical protein
MSQVGGLRGNFNPRARAFLNVKTNGLSKIFLAIRKQPNKINHRCVFLVLFFAVIPAKAGIWSDSS